MENRLKEIIGILERQLDEYKKLLKLMQVERERMVELDVEALKEITVQKENVLLRIGYLEQGRKEAVIRFSAEIGIPLDECTMTRIAELSTEPMNSKFQLLQSTMKSLVMSIQDLNSINKGLVQISLRSINQAIGFVNKRTGNNTYTGTGSFAARSKTGKVMEMDV